ncbi:hypothetical protein [Nocardia camponoti]|uniref:hypothetical protein n=1 Tax=Nocardia camponoti TaxID=1616106 RepID=UPI0027E46C30|nr:hypothetical protein [Nocardia camponoti]
MDAAGPATFLDAGDPESAGSDARPIAPLVASATPEVDAAPRSTGTPESADSGPTAEAGGRAGASSPVAPAHAEPTPSLLSLDIDTAVSTAFPTRDITDVQATDLREGRWLDPIGIKGVYAAIDPTGRAIALLQESGKRAASVMLVRPKGMGD